jgi:hypothetical protein
VARSTLPAEVVSTHSRALGQATLVRSWPVVVACQAAAALAGSVETNTRPRLSKVVHSQRDAHAIASRS